MASLPAEQAGDGARQKQAALAEIQPQIPAAIEEGEDEAASCSSRRRTASTRPLPKSNRFEKVSGQADDAKAGLVAFQGEIEKLKREARDARQEGQCEARIQIQETLDGLSTDADIRALENVREGIDKLQAEADVGAEIDDSNLDAKLDEIKAKTATASARSQLDEMKKQMAAQKAAKEGKVEKTI